MNLDSSSSVISMIDEGHYVKIIDNANKLTKKCAMYAGQIGKVINGETVSKRFYREVKFDNGDIAAYLPDELIAIRGDRGEFYTERPEVE